MCNGAGRLQQYRADRLRFRIGLGLRHGFGDGFGHRIGDAGFDRHRQLAERKWFGHHRAILDHVRNGIEQLDLRQYRRHLVFRVDWHPLTGNS